MPCYRFPLPRVHGSLVAFLIRLGRAVGLVAPAAAEQQMSRRHRLMLAVDQRHAAERMQGGTASRFDLSSFAMACGTWHVDPPGNDRLGLPVSRKGERSMRDMEIAARLLIAQRQLKLEEQHGEHVRSYGLDDAAANANVVARRRQIALLRKLGRSDPLVIAKTRARAEISA